MKQPKLNLHILVFPFIFLITGFTIVSQNTNLDKVLESNSIKIINDFDTKKIEGYYVNSNGDFLDIHLNNVCRIKINNQIQEGKYAVQEDGYFEYMTTEGIIVEAIIHLKNERLIFALNDERFEFRYKGPSKIFEKERIKISKKASTYVDTYNDKLLKASSNLYTPSFSVINN